jgi:serine/threonine protein kinase
LAEDRPQTSPVTVAERPGGSIPPRDAVPSGETATVSERLAGASRSVPPGGSNTGAVSGGLVPETLIGKVIDGRYEIIKPLAEGGMGSVFLAEQTGLRRKVALKVLVSEDPELVVRFQREATALAEVSHPAIVEIYDFTAHAVEAGNRGCLCMAYIDGMDLADYLDQQPVRCLPPKEVMTLVIPIISALVELHANGIIHRDIKPANIVRFLRADGRPGVKLVDFGIARRQVDPGMTASGLVLGTPPYLPPEAFLGEKATPLMDIYALGATMFELLTGAPPFAAEGQARIIQRTLHEDPQFPEHLAGTPLAALVGQMLGKIARNRPDAMQVLKGLEAVRAGRRPDLGAASGDAAVPNKPTRELQPTPARPDASRVDATESLEAVAQRRPGGRGLAIALGLLVVAEAAVIVYLLFGRSLGIG